MQFSCRVNLFETDFSFSVYFQIYFATQLLAETLINYNIQYNLSQTYLLNDNDGF